MNNEHKGLARLLWAVSLLTLVTILAFAAYSVMVHADIGNLKRTVEKLESLQTVKPINGRTPVKGIDYVDGQDGLAGKQGQDGKDSLSTHTETTIIKEQPGEKGDRGNDGQSIDVFVDPMSCLLMTKTHNDTSWSIQAQLPKPCEVL